MAATLTDLIQGLPGFIQGTPLSDAQRQQLENQLVERVRPDIERTAGNKALAVNESAFGRGLGLSTVNAYAQAENQRARDEALAKARIDAANQALTAQRAAIAQAASFAASEQNRQQQASQFQQSLAEQQKQFASRQGLARGTAVGSGLAALTGAGLRGLLSPYRPGERTALGDIRDWMKNKLAGAGEQYGRGYPTENPPSASPITSAGEPIPTQGTGPIDYGVTPSDFSSSTGAISTPDTSYSYPDFSNGGYDWGYNMPVGYNLPDFGLGSLFNTDLFNTSGF